MKKVYPITDFLFSCLKFTICLVRTKKWLEKSSTIKEEKEDFLLTKTHKLTSFFQVVEKEAEHSSGDLHSNSPPISFYLDTVQDKIFSHDDNDMQ